MKLLWEYIKHRRFYALLLLVLDGLFTLMFWLTQADGSAPMYMLLLFTVLELAAAAIDLRHFAQRHRDIQVQLGRIFAAADGLPEPDSLIEADYQELVRAVCADSARARSEADLRHALADAANQPDIAVLLVTEKIAETYTATLDSARAAGGPLLITVPSTGGGAAGKDRLTRYIREAIGVKI